ncbi:NADPH-dependent 2,4-dienoyl-CoA reductase/sulfur reductase-like enzyme [Rhizobium azibense]|uniref:NADPH-dependent 2,4-dienoyl-CoA reductase/sulfur reductase-like enzyme n=1 Tax=Rhizobium azibense TaxID=1136135 RepID=A0A4R3QJG8_9HYPH|nr:NADPH-dependent 2,4-dienoyl-CoA reductase/sulfur reductase-like enzyme [Rhizobium azibense]
MRLDRPMVIIGAGPAGISAAKTLAAAGERPVVIDENAYPGGQIFRRPPAALARNETQLYGFDASRARRLKSTFEAIAPSIEYRAETLVWSVEDRRLHLSTAGIVKCMPFSRILLAAGAMDRVIPINGWTAPGVFSLGAAQIALKAQATFIGKRVVFIGTGPLLYLVAYQYAKAGADVAAVLDSSEPFSKITPLPALLADISNFSRGLFYVSQLLLRGVKIQTAIAPIEIVAGDRGVTSIRYEQSGQQGQSDCDAVAIGYGLRSETQLADLLGLSFQFDRRQRQWLPVTDGAGRTSVPHVYIAGDGASVRGSEVAEWEGELAALSLLEDMGRGSQKRASVLRRRIDSLSPFRRALDDHVFPFPHHFAEAIRDETIVCRCEGITAGQIRETVATTGEADINRIKAFSRLGMGRCQGRVCGAAACELIAATARTDISATGRLRGQAPLKPIPLSILAGDRR